MTSSFDPNNKYFVDVANPSTKSGRIRKSLGLDHFKTNFSLEGTGELNQNKEFNNQRTFQPVGFGKTFDYVEQSKTFIHTVDTVLVPAHSHEIIYSDTPANSDSANYNFGRAVQMNDSGGTAVLSFWGVACGGAFVTGTSNGMFTVELSKDNGSTYSHKKTFTTDVSTTTTSEVAILFYENLPIAEYKIKITQLAGTVLTQVAYLWYTTYMNQRGVEQYYKENTASKAIATDLPPTTFKFVGANWTVCAADASPWGDVRSYTYTNDEYVEFYFYGSKCWLGLSGHNTGDGTFTPLIDGATTYLKATTFSTYQPNNVANWWIRIDDGRLTEGWHTLKITKTSGASKALVIFGAGYYSTNSQTTTTKPVICGKDSYFVGIDDAGWTRTGSWTVGKSGPMTLRRYAGTSTNNDTTNITTPNNTNLKAIYLVMANYSNGGNITVSLGGNSSNLRYLNLDGDFVSEDVVFTIYDSFRDGPLHNQVLKVTKIDGTNLFITGIIYEIGDAVENGYLWCFPKMNYVRTSTNLQEPKSNTYRLDVYGVCSEGGNWAQPHVFSYWCPNAASTTYYRPGFPTYPGKDIIQIVTHSVTNGLPANGQSRVNWAVDSVDTTTVVGTIGYNPSGIGTRKIVVRPDRVW